MEEQIPVTSSENLWRDVLGSPRYVVAPMVDQSETAWRMLSRRYGAQLCYTPMYHASMFVRDAKYRSDCLTRSPEDRPLIIQFCCNSVPTLVEVARHCVGKFDALDLNLGCPQAIARRGHYGAYLQDEWQLIASMVNAVHTQVAIPITCKIRVFECVEKTVRYALMLQSAGCRMLTVHGRTRQQRGPLTGLADWRHIGAVVAALSIPVLANGNILSLHDVHRCMEETGAVGVMTAETNLHNPALFAGLAPPVWQMAEEYLRLVDTYPCPLSYSRGHIFKLLHHCLQLPANCDIRQLVATAADTQQLLQAVQLIRRKYEPFVRYSSPSGTCTVLPWQLSQHEKDVSERLPFAPFICQPYQREPIADYLAKMKAGQQRQQAAAAATADSAEEKSDQQQQSADSSQPAISKRQQKKMARGRLMGGSRQVFQQCANCHNPRGLRCDYLLCRVHCRTHCYDRELDCAGHRIMCLSRRQVARQFYTTLRVDERGADTASADAKLTSNGANCVENNGCDINGAVSDCAGESHVTPLDPAALDPIGTVT